MLNTTYKLKKALGFLALFFLLGCKSEKEFPQSKSNTDYVNPFIGTGGHGHTYPGATMPFGMVQLSPDTRLEGWDGCSGYHYTDSIIYGFSHTHLSGTGISDYGDVLLMPTSGKLHFDNGYKGNLDEGYGSRFSHEHEFASPGFYSVKLEDYDIDVALTVTPRVGFHEYTFNKGGTSHVILDLSHRDTLLEHNLEVVNATTIQGKRISKAWADEQYVYFYMQFSKPFIEAVSPDNQVKSTEKIAFSFNTEPGEKIYVKLGLSAVSETGAKANLEAELSDWNFESIKQEAQQNWGKQLDKIQVKGGTADQKTIFYTALYHSLLSPNLYQDVDGKYRGMDLEVHKTKSHTNYSVFSLWDTFRATHPLYTIIEQKRTNDFINTFLDQYEKGGLLPIWELAGNYTGCMIGYHSIPVITDAYVKGIRGYDAQKVFKAMLHSANQDHLGLKSYKSLGYIPADHEAESVSKTLEYAYDDWCISKMAALLNQPETASYFLERSQFYKNIFDPESGFMRAKVNGNWFGPFDPSEVNFNYTEANAWQYSLFVPQDIEGLISLYGGPKPFEKQLDNLFAASTDLVGRQQADITGLIGQYAHGNEPSHHMAYFYNYIGKPHKTQFRIRQILESLYQNSPEGLSGNEDCGQMSSWYVLSAMGFYPVTPGLPYYTLGAPIFDEVAIYMENGNTFKITSKNNSSKHFYVQDVTLNGQSYKKSFLNHETIMKGGSLSFVMSDTPNSNAFLEQPTASIKASLISPVPYFESESKTFTGSQEVVIRGLDYEDEVFYSIDNKDFKRYTSPIIITKSTNFKAYAVRDGKKSYEVQASYFKIDGNRKIDLKTSYVNQYAAGGDNALIDYMRGGNNFRTGTWQGYQGQDLNAIVDLGSVKSLSALGIGFLQDVKSWVYFPKSVLFEGSEDGKAYKTLGKVTHSFSDQLEGSKTHDFEINKKMKLRYIRIKAESYGVNPQWHPGAGEPTWLFADEIYIKP